MILVMLSVCVRARVCVCVHMRVCLQVQVHDGRPEASHGFLWSLSTLCFRGRVSHGPWKPSIWLDCLELQIHLSTRSLPSGGYRHTPHTTTPPLQASYMFLWSELRSPSATAISPTQLLCHISEAERVFISVSCVLCPLHFDGWLVFLLISVHSFYIRGVSLFVVWLANIFPQVGICCFDSLADLTIGNIFMQLFHLWLLGLLLYLGLKMALEFLDCTRRISPGFVQCLEDLNI